MPYDNDGILYLSRLTGTKCLGVYDRAVATKLEATQVVNVVTAANLVPALARLIVRLLGAAARIPFPPESRGPRRGARA